MNLTLHGKLPALIIEGDATGRWSLLKFLATLDAGARLHGTEIQPSDMTKVRWVVTVQSSDNAEVDVPEGVGKVSFRNGWSYVRLQVSPSQFGMLQSSALSEVHFEFSVSVLGTKRSERDEIWDTKSELTVNSFTITAERAATERAADLPTITG